MVYTIGIKENYDKWLKEYKPLKKKVGGSVWKNWADAAQCASQSTVMQGKAFSVYTVKADWEKDTIAVDENVWRALKEDAVIVDPDEPDVVFTYRILRSGARFIPIP